MATTWKQASKDYKKHLYERHLLEETDLSLTENTFDLAAFKRNPERFFDENGWTVPEEHFEEITVALAELAQSDSEISPEEVELGRKGKKVQEIVQELAKKDKRFASIMKMVSQKNHLTEGKGKRILATSLLCLAILLTGVGCASLNPFLNDYQISSTADITVTETWTVNNFEDQYGKPIENKKYIGGWSIDGHFANSATQDSECTAFFRVGYDGQISIFILEYGEYIVHSHGNTEWYYASLIKDEKVIAETKSSLIGNSFNIGIYSTINTAADTFMDIFCEGGKVQLRLYNSSKALYLITFDTTGFAAALKELFPNSK